ncbi:hypothetical protein REPUB_Repub17cG0047300 [Reevesia pubescens]
MDFTRKKSAIFLIAITIFFSLLQPSSSNLTTAERIDVGVILDMKSWVGKMAGSCISLASSDFYSLNGHYKTKLVLHNRDSKGEPLLALSQENSDGVKILAELGFRVKIPIVSLFAGGPSLPFSKYPYLIQIGQDESSQAKGIATIVEAFSWRNIILISEDNDSAREILSKVTTSLEGADVRLAQHIAILASSTDEEIIGQLKVLMRLQMTVYMVHMSPSLASCLFLNAKQLGMVSQGYAWITTDMIMNFLHSMEPSVIESMQGVVGFKPYIPASKELRKFTLRWRRNFFVETQNLQDMELNIYGIWTYDMVWALATAAERVKIGHPDIMHQETRLNLNFTIICSSQSGLVFIDEILQSRFKGISGGFQLANGRLSPKEFEIVNVFKREKYTTVIWRGGTKNIPKGWSLYDKRLRIGVPVNTGFRELINVIIDRQRNETTVSGCYVEVLKAAIETLDYEVKYEFIPFVNASGQMAGSYDDLIHQVYLKNYDAVVGDTTIFASRFSYVDFTLPYTDLGIGMVAPKTSKNSMWIFLKPLSGDLWTTTAALFIFTGLVVWLIESPINSEFQGSASKQVGTILWSSFSTLVFAPNEKLLSNLSKFVVIVWVFVVLILSSSYTATLTSMLTIQQIRLTSREDSIGYHSAFFAPKSN